MKATHRIVKVHESDAYYDYRDLLEGAEGVFTPDITEEEGETKRVAGEFVFNQAVSIEGYKVYDTFFAFIEIEEI